MSKGVTSEARFSAERTVNEIANSSVVSVLTAALTRNLDYAQFYPTMPRDEAYARARRLVATPGAATLTWTAEAARTYDPQAILRSGERQDLSNEIIITIDPDDARDFDDAISLRALRSTRERQDDDKCDQALVGLQVRKQLEHEWFKFYRSRQGSGV